jgi:vanillate O-demethylase monooxygenase subunit
MGEEMLNRVLKNCWYAAAWTDELSDETLARRLVDIPIVLFRAESGLPAVLEDRCAHRFAPLHSGQLINGALECPYHGLRFNGAGECISNPHNFGKPLRAAKIRSFPVIERYGVVWFWPGDITLAHSASIPDIGATAGYGMPRWRRVQDVLNLAAQYDLIVDNLLDLSHVGFLHPHLLDASGTWSGKTKAHGQGLTSTYVMPDIPVSAAYRDMWTDAPERGDKWATSVWLPPSVVQLSSGWSPSGGIGGVEGITFIGAHLITPETATTSHYFWSAGRSFRTDDQRLDKLLIDATKLAFEGQDKPMIEAQQRNLSNEGIWDAKPTLLSIDSGIVRRKRIMDKLLAAELSEPASRPAGNDMRPSE